MYIQGACYLIVLAFSIFVLPFAQAGEPRNLSLVKQDLIRYHDSGEYQKDLARVIQQAKAYLSTRIEQNKSKHRHQKLAIILDVDETALSNYPDLVTMDFGGTQKEIEEAEGKGSDSAIEPILKFYRFAKEQGVAVFFITARRETYRQVTAVNLENAGYKNYDSLFLMPVDYPEKSVTGFKTGIRKQLSKQGYDIILSLSDQKVDLRGGYADKAFKLPNPYYLVS